MNKRSLPALLLFCGTTASAQILEGFEHGNESLWIQATPIDNMTLNASSAHDGLFGAQFDDTSNPGFRLRTDLVTSPGARYFAHVRARGTASGRVYLGVGATATGAYSAVFAPNTGEIIIQNNSGWSFVDLASTAFIPVPETWYILALDWLESGDMRASIWDDTMATQLATTPTATTGITVPGGLSLRGFSLSITSFSDIDTITRQKSCYANCDGSTAAPCLNVSDFNCFFDRYATNNPYANCDSSTISPVLNVTDFICFMNRYSAGCGAASCAP